MSVIRGAYSTLREWLSVMCDTERVKQVYVVRSRGLIRDLRHTGVVLEPCEDTERLEDERVSTWESLEPGKDVFDRSSPPPPPTATFFTLR